LLLLILFLMEEEVWKSWWRIYWYCFCRLGTAWKTWSKWDNYFLRARTSRLVIYFV